MAAVNYGVVRTDMVEVDDGNFRYDDTVHVETSQKSFRDFSIRPLGGVTDQHGPFIFQIDQMVDKYLQLNKARLYVRAKVVRADGTALDWSDVVAPLNLLGTTMWKSVEVSLNDQPFSGASAVEAGYKSFMEAALSYDQDAAETHLRSQFYFKDDPGKHGSFYYPEKEARKNYMMQMKDTNHHGLYPPVIPEADKSVEKIHRLYPHWYDDVSVMEHPLSWTDDNKMIDPDTGVEFVIPPIESEDATIAVSQAEIDDDNARRSRRRKLYRDQFLALADKFGMSQAVTADDTLLNRGFVNRANMCMLSKSFDMYSPVPHDFFRLNNHVGPSNKIDIRLVMNNHSFMLCSPYGESFRKYRLVIEDMQLFLHTIERRERVDPPLTEKYLMNETQLHKHIVGAHMPGTTIRIHNGGVMPKTIILGIVVTSAADGDLYYNPLNFHHCNLENVSLLINGETYPTGGLSFNFEASNNLTARTYSWVFENTGADGGTRGNLINWTNFSNGMFLLPFDLTPDKCNGVHYHDAVYGFIDVVLHFRKPLTDPIYLMSYQMFPKIVLSEKLISEVTAVDIESGNTRG